MLTEAFILKTEERSYLKDGKDMLTVIFKAEERCKPVSTPRKREGIMARHLS
jgi:hypothetical protein